MYACCFQNGGLTCHSTASPRIHGLRWFMIKELKLADYRAVAAYYALLTERPAHRKHVRNGIP
jgi:hypothetical protein